jgi:anaerobic selenocysteine-containing dehydrogenase
MNGIIHQLIKERWVDLNFIDAHTVGFKPVG